MLMSFTFTFGVVSTLGFLAKTVAFDCNKPILQSNAFKNIMICLTLHSMRTLRGISLSYYEKRRFTSHILDR